MEPTRSLRCSVSEFLALVNQTLDFAYPSIEVEGEVASFKVNQNKYVFFDLKDENGTVNCFMTVWQLRMPIEEGMRIVVTATPKITQWGKFSLTVRALRPIGEGALKKSAELLQQKLQKEGLFAPEKKRSIPRPPTRIGLISSTQAAGYADFLKILDARWGATAVDVAHVQVQGLAAPQQIMRALEYFNERASDYDAVVIVRGGGSADDLAAFNDEPLVRAIAASRLPVMTGIGHEVDTSLADLAADVAATTPSNAAERLVPDRQEQIAIVRRSIDGLGVRLVREIEQFERQTSMQLRSTLGTIESRLVQTQDTVAAKTRLLAEFNPDHVLARGYAIVRGRIAPGSEIAIETSSTIIDAEVINVHEK